MSTFIKSSYGSIDPPIRVALFADTWDEANGVATLCRHLATFARYRDLPLFVVRGGPETRYTRDGSVETLEVKRGPASFCVDQNLCCDLLLTRHRHFVAERLSAFKPDLVHMTGPGDAGFLGLWVAHMLPVPLIASWHTNLHEYLSQRLNRSLHLIPDPLRRAACNFVERETLRGLFRFYRTSRFVFAPNQTMVDLLHARTGKPAFLMPHGVDLSQYCPSRKRDRTGAPFCIGYVGRLTTEKNIHLFQELERKLLAAGETNYRFLIVGEGSQKNWLRQHLQRAEITGVLRGDQLAEAYSRMDAFVFPSRTDTFGLVILEAMASGIPVIAAPETGERAGLEHGVSGFLTHDFAPSLLTLMRNRTLCSTMGLEARKAANRSGWDTVFEQLYCSYSEGLSLITSERVSIPM